MHVRIPCALLCTLFCVAPAAGAGGSPPSPVEAEVAAVTVYRDRAEVRRVAKRVPLHAGRNAVRFAGLPLRMDPATIRVSGSSDTDAHVVSIDAVRLAEPHVPSPAETRELDGIAARSRELEARRSALDAGRAFLDALVAAPVQGRSGLETLAGTPGSALADALAFLVDSVNTNRLESARVTEEILRLDRRAGELRGSKEEDDDPLEMPWAVDVELDAAAAATCDLTIEYTTLGASWTPAYDIEVSEDLRTIRIVYEASVSQTTGEDWTGVRVRLSTTQPGLRAAVPSLSPWWLSIPEPAPPPGETAYCGGRSSEVKSMLPLGAASGHAMRVIDTQAQSRVRAIMATPEAVVTSTHDLATSFDIEARQDLPSDGRSRRLRIAVVDAEGEVRHECAPKQSTQVHLVATVRNRSDYPLLRGSTRIVLGGSELGRGTMESVAPGEEFDLALGVDPSVSVERRMVRRRDDSSGSQWASDVTWGLRVTNHRREEVRVKVRDQVPLSPDEDVSVRLHDVEPDPAEDPMEDGLLLWNLAVPAGEERNATFRYEVKYPPSKRPRNL